MKTAVLVLCCISFGSADAALRLGSPFADGMVLQRGKPVPVWGWADSGAEVSVSFAGQVRTATAGTNGAWRVNFAPLEASSVGRTLTVSSQPPNSSTSQLVLSDVLVGEVWFCAGQSNMELPLVGWNPRFRDGKGALVAQWMNDPEIRFVHASNYKWSAVPRAEAAYKVEWKKVTPKSVTSGNSFSAVALYYALELRRALNVPVGLVGTYWGGTMIQPWTPKSGFALAPNCAPEAEYVPRSAEEIAAGAKIPYEKHAQPGVLWNEMVSPWTPLAIRGFIWYQGCSNAAQWKHYADLMHALYRGWAKEFENPDLRLEFVQLAPWGEDVIPRIQQAQAKFAAEEPLANMAVINDIGNIHDIHPNEKQLVGQRLAALALRHDYGWDIKADSSVVKSFEVTDGAFRLKFDDPSGFYLYNPDYNMRSNGFEVAGADGVWHRAEIANNHWHYVGSGKYRKLWSWGVLTGDTVVVRSPEVPEPRKLRYLHSHPWFGSLYNSVNLPVGAFELVAPADATNAMARFVTGGERVRAWKVDERGWWHARLPAGTRCSHFFVNGVRRQRPFLPRKGYFLLDEAPAAAATSPQQLMAVRPGQIPDGTDWTDAEMCVFQTWTMCRLPVAAYDPATRVVTSAADRVPYSYMPFGKWQWYRLDNVRSALGEPGDWHLDRSGELIYVPHPGENPEKAECWAAVRPHALVLDGVTNRVIRGVTFAYSGWDMPEKGQVYQQAGANVSAAVLVTRSKNVRFEDCTFIHTGGYGLEFGAGAVGCAAVNCTFRDLGAGGVKIGSEWAGSAKPETWAHGCRVEDCLVESGGRFEPAGVGIWVGNADGCQIVRNTVRDLYYSGISVGWTWKSVPNAAHHNRVAFNDVSAIGQRRLSDMGGIYLLGDQPGTVVEGNLVRDVTTARGFGHGIYLDQGSSRMAIVSNHVETAEGVAFYLQYSTVSNRVVGNVFVGGEEAVLRHCGDKGRGTLPSLFADNAIWWDDPDCQFCLPQPASCEYVDSHDNISCLSGSHLAYETLGTARKEFPRPRPPKGCGRRAAPPPQTSPVPAVFDPAPVHVLGDRPGAALTNGSARAVFDACGCLTSLSAGEVELLPAPVPFVELKLTDGRTLRPTGLRNEDNAYLNFVFAGGECWLKVTAASAGWTLRTLKLSVPDVAELSLHSGPNRPATVFAREFGFLRKDFTLNP